METIVGGPVRPMVSGGDALGAAGGADVWEASLFGVVFCLLLGAPCTDRLVIVLLGIWASLPDAGFGSPVWTW
ncbi:hypothetical protein [Rhodococcus sp. NPDC057529]|uniref:hypothetical protein n=1 Tax=Rhodococcus sp. NPDC057529 TaxID=3346158 RepID=UPI003671C08D